EGVHKFVAPAEQLRAELDQKYGSGDRSLVKHVLVSVGEQPSRANQNQQPGNRSSSSFTRSHPGDSPVPLGRSEERPIRTRDIADRWRELTGVVPEAVELEFSSAFF